MDANRNTRRAFALVLLVFVLGVALGALSAYVAAGRVWGARPAAESHREKRARMVEQLSRDLNLTADQRRQLEAILNDMGSKYQAMHEQMAPQSEQIRRQGREQIRAILTPEQRPKFEEFMSRVDQERNKRKNEH